MSGKTKVVLHVRPIDPSEPGSYWMRRQFQRASSEVLRLQDAAQKASEAGDDRETINLQLEAMSLIDGLEELLISRLYTENGSSVEEALRIISIDDWGELMSAASETSVPQQSAEPSTGGLNESPAQASPGG